MARGVSKDRQDEQHLLVITSVVQKRNRYSQKDQLYD